MVSTCKHCYVDGRVQGVFYRASACKKAIELGLAGWVRNLEDGRVEVMMQGSETQISDMMDWLWLGPTNAEVVSVQCTDEPTDIMNNFSVKH